MLTIREGRPDDAEGITRIHLIGWQRGYADLMPAAYLARRVAEEPERTAQRRTHRRDLRDHVDAISVLFDHARETAHLTFDALQAFQH